jgi:hypothetical protein
MTEAGMIPPTRSLLKKSKSGILLGQIRVVAERKDVNPEWGKSDSRR